MVRRTRTRVKHKILNENGIKWIYLTDNNDELIRSDTFVSLEEMQ